MLTFRIPKNLGNGREDKNGCRYTIFNFDNKKPFPKDCAKIIISPP